MKLMTENEITQAVEKEHDRMLAATGDKDKAKRAAIKYRKTLIEIRDRTAHDARKKQRVEQDAAMTREEREEMIRVKGEIQMFLRLARVHMEDIAGNTIAGDLPFSLKHGENVIGWLMQAAEAYARGEIKGVA